MADNAVQDGTHDCSGDGSEKPTHWTGYLEEQDATDYRTHHPVPESLVPHRLLRLPGRQGQDSLGRIKDPGMNVQRE
jgi:hypothetical protein